MEILGETTRKVDHLNAFLKSKGCPEYAQFYSNAGKKYGVRWDMAIFQSCLETGFWKFGGDVKVTQHNFAGIGARGGGEAGDSFTSPQVGIEAQIQGLALRAGKFISVGEILSPYVAKNYELISKRNTKTWESLSGTYAADLRYHEKVFAIMKEFDLFVLGLPKEDKKATWINITSASGLAVQAMAGTESIETLKGNSVEKLVTFLEEYMESARTFAVGGRFPDAPEQPKPEEPKPNEPWLKQEWLPFAKKAKAQMPVRATKWPKYLIIHWTAGDPNQNGEDGIAFGAKSGYTYMFLERKGQLWQGAPANGGGYHIGNASISSLDCLGVETACAGKLEKIGSLYVPWFAKNKDGSINKARCIQESEIIYDGDDTKDDGSFAGYYQRFTSEQMRTLTKLALYCVQVLGIAVENIRGHDEVATPRGRKTDPGASIGAGGMVGFRKEIALLIKQGKKWTDY
jgi:hypothetical protein